jgi:uncharacterized membrane-anchored protein YhcB (DUF1043 family)
VTWLYATVAVTAGVVVGFVWGCHASRRWLEQQVSTWDRLGDDARTRIIDSLHPIDGTDR